LNSVARLASSRISASRFLLEFRDQMAELRRPLSRFAKRSRSDRPVALDASPQL